MGEGEERGEWYTAYTWNLKRKVTVFLSKSQVLGAEQAVTSEGGLTQVNAVSGDPDPYRWV